MSITRITDHVTQGLALLIDQYRNKPRIRAWVSSYLRRIQEQEDTIWDVIDSRMLDNATNAQLDVLGRIVGQPRIGATDDDYRLFIRTKIRANRSRGLSVDIIEVVIAAMDGATESFRYIELYPATILIDMVWQLDQLGVTPTFLRDIVTFAKPSGVALAFHYSQSEEDDGTFACSDTDMPQLDLGRGASDEAGLVGGTLVSAI